MDIAILILVIVAVILLGILTFFIFQIWINATEAKIQLTNNLQEIKYLENKLEDVRSEIIKNIDKHIQIYQGNISDGLESVKTKTNSAIEGLSDSVKHFKDNIDSRIKELDYNLSDKLVKDLTHLTNSYSKNLKEEQSNVLDRFEQTSKEISNKQSNILKAITEPLKINLNDND
jgi:type II secretory pathway pseudopilin PulG